MKRGHLARDLAIASMRRVSVANPAEGKQRYEQAAAYVDQTLRNYGPAPLGYFHWIAVDGQMSQMAEYGGQSATMPQRRWYWLVRVLASVLLLGYGFRLQVKELAKPEEPVEPGPSPAGEM